MKHTPLLSLLLLFSLTFGGCDDPNAAMTVNCDQAWRDKLNLLSEDSGSPGQCGAYWSRITTSKETVYVGRYPCANGDFPVYDCEGIEAFPDGSLGVESEILTELFAEDPEFVEEIVGYFP